MCDIIGNPQELLRSISDRRKLEPNGDPSLENVVNMARGTMRYNKFMYDDNISN